MDVLKTALVILPLMSLVSAQRQSLMLYENADFSGRFLLADGNNDVDPYCEDIAVCSGDPSFEDIMSSATLTGLWIFYSEPNYGEAGPGVEAHWGDNVRFQFNTVNDRLSSFKYVGLFEDWSKDSLTLYSREYFRGEEEEYFTASGNVEFVRTQRSVIVAGITAWTLYAEPNFKGDSICVETDNDQGWPGYITDLELEGIFAVGSVEVGCAVDAQERIYAKSFPALNAPEN